MSRLILENPETRILDFVQKLQPHHPEELRKALLTLAQKVVVTIMRPEDLVLLRALIADSHRFPQLTEIIRSTIPQRAAVEVSRMLARAQENGVAIQPGDPEIMTRLFIGPIVSYVVFDGLLRPQSQPQLPSYEGDSRLEMHQPEI